MKYLIWISLVFVLGCSTGKKALEKGRYKEAVLSSIDRLRQNPDHKKAAETLVKGYPVFLDYSLDRVNRLKPSGEVFKWEQIIGHYNDINEVYDKIQRSPKAKDLISGARYIGSEIEDAKIKAAEVRYSLGLSFMEKARERKRDAALIALNHFKEVSFYYPGFRNVNELAEEALDLSVLRVGIEPIQVPTGRLEFDAIFFFNQILSYYKAEIETPVIQFELAHNRNDYDHIIRLSFDELVIGQTLIVEKQLDRTKDSVVVGTVKVKEELGEIEKEVLGKVNAKVRYFEKAIDSYGTLTMQILDTQTGFVLSDKKFRGGFTWLDYWGSFNGDQRALLDEDKIYVAKNSEARIPPPQDFFIQIVRPIYRDLTLFSKSFYRPFNRP
jgi:hypothetical protein